MRARDVRPPIPQDPYAAAPTVITDRDPGDENPDPIKSLTDRVLWARTGEPPRWALPQADGCGQ
jgi:hypothetical protein